MFFYPNRKNLVELVEMNQDNLCFLFYFPPHFVLSIKNNVYNFTSFELSSCFLNRHAYTTHQEIGIYILRINEANRGSYSKENCCPPTPLFCTSIFPFRAPLLYRLFSLRESLRKCMFIPPPTIPCFQYIYFKFILCRGR